MEIYTIGTVTERRQVMLRREDFTIAYASAMTAPSNHEIDYIKMNVHEFTSGLPDSVFEHNGCIECHCIDEKIDDYINYAMYCWEVLIPQEIAVDPQNYEGEERRLSILQCGNCGKWGLCD
ncbi:hypothetical protein [Mesobacillus foraminis]|uniref:hypothetical protein n=1 Tax=Mesobacillus foraminis TaxID=279826 RepID=UPI000EF46078|nr:hypothetical protein [Mesobacillus foraminis]